MENSKNNLYTFCLRLGDSPLVLGHRLSEWCGHAPLLEEDIALSNMALDLIGQSRAFYTYAASLEGRGKTEDDIAYLRDAREFYNLMLVEQPNGDFAMTIVRSYLYSVFSFLNYGFLKGSKDDTIAGIAEKGLKEVKYHLRHTADWILRLGNGTEESNERTQNAINELWPYTFELFATDDIHSELVKENIAFNISPLKDEWDRITGELLKRSSLIIPQGNIYKAAGSINGIHTEHLGYLLAEMQFLQRAYPDLKW